MNGWLVMLGGRPIGLYADIADAIATMADATRKELAANRITPCELIAFIAGKPVEGTAR